MFLSPGDRPGVLGLLFRTSTSPTSPYSSGPLDWCRVSRTGVVGNEEGVGEEEGGSDKVGRDDKSDRHINGLERVLES